MQTIGNINPNRGNGSKALQIQNKIACKFWGVVSYTTITIKEDKKTYKNTSISWWKGGAGGIACYANGRTPPPPPDMALYKKNTITVLLELVNQGIECHNLFEDQNGLYELY